MINAHRKAVAVLVAGLGLWACSERADGRPLKVDDILKMEALGETLISPDERWLVFERRGPYAKGERFDYDRYSDLFRTTLQVADLAAPTPVRPLFAHEPEVGYAAGPMSPDGVRQAVFRLKRDRWEMGVVVLATGDVTWTGLTPDYPEWGRAVQWRSASELVAITVPDGRLPFILRQAFLTGRMVRNWSSQARGGLALTVLGSGDYAALRPRDPPREVTVFDVATGAARRVAKGEFTDLELSSDGRFAAVLRAGPDVRMWPDQDFRTDTNIIRTRLRLTLIDLGSGEISRPCPDCDVLSQLLAWSPRGHELLIYARHDDQPWANGELFQLSANTGQMRALTGTALRPKVFRRPETVIAGWLGEDPLVYAQASGDARAEIWRLSTKPVSITGQLPEFELAGAASAGGRLLMISQGRAVALDGTGRVRAQTRFPVAGPPAPMSYPVRRMTVSLSAGAALGGLGTVGDETRWTRLTASGKTSHLRAPPGSELLEAGANGGGVLVRVSHGGGEDEILWVGSDGVATSLATLNAHLRDVDRPRVHAVRHPGPDGERLVSWLALPADASLTTPLIVFPYLGRSHRQPPPYLNPRLSPGVDWPRLLVGHGYAVLMPSLPISSEAQAPSDGVAEAVLAIVDVAATQATTKDGFDPDRLGVLGDSFGGYSTIAIITQTDRFKAAVAWAAMPNLIAKWGDFGPPSRVSVERGAPSPQWTEGFQGDMRGPPWKTLDRYVAGSPNLHLDHAVTPLLIGHGELDNFPVGEAEQTFFGYLRQNRNAILATYWGEGHRLRSPANLRDFHLRALAFLDHHLRPAAASTEATDGLSAGRSDKSITTPDPTTAPAAIISIAPKASGPDLMVKAAGLDRDSSIDGPTPRSWRPGTGETHLLSK